MKGKHRMRRPTRERPLVYYAVGHWFRSGHESRYDAWPVLNPLTPYQEKLVTR